MADHPAQRPINTRLLIVGAVLAAVGGLLATIGFSLGAAALAAAARRWQQRTEMSPGELARHAVWSARAGSSAGVQAWRAAPAPSGPGRGAPDGR